jgi:hypothetical protein
MDSRRRAFLGASLGVGLAGVRAAAAQQPSGQGSATARTESGRGGSGVPVRQGKLTKLFKSPEGYPNAIALSPQGWWIGEQKSDNAVLVDWNGKLLKTVKTESKNTSGIGFGDGFIWMGANAAPEGIFQTDMNSKTIRHLQIPLGGADGGGCHGVMYVDGKVWLAALRLRGILRVDARTWEPEFLIPYNVPRAHGIAWDNGAVWMVTGASDGKAGLNKYDASTGRLLETVVFNELYPDPHGLAIKDGVMYTCDAGIHPGWEENVSSAHGYVCRVDIG